MIVKELITKLQKCNPDLDVWAAVNNDDLINDSSAVTGIAQITMTEDNDRVVIEYE